MKIYKWVPKPPTTAGYYWFCYKGVAGPVYVVKIYKDLDGQMASSDGYDLKKDLAGRYWWGPIFKPEHVLGNDL